MRYPHKGSSTIPFFSNQVSYNLYSLTTLYLLSFSTQATHQQNYLAASYSNI